MKNLLIKMAITSVVVIPILATSAQAKPVPKVTGGIYMGNPSQQIDFAAFGTGDPNTSKGTIEYWNYDYPGVLHYTANVLCANVNEKTREANFVFQIPEGWPGLTGIYVIAYVQDNGTPGAKGDLYGHTATGDFNTAMQMCKSSTPLYNYPITNGNLVVH